MNTGSVLQMFSALKGKDLGGIVQSLINSNPQAQQAWQQAQQLAKGKSDDELVMLVDNMCKQRGTTLNDVASALGCQK